MEKQDETKVKTVKASVTQENHEEPKVKKAAEVVPGQREMSFDGTFVEDLEDDAVRMFEKYEVNKKFLDVLKGNKKEGIDPEPIVGIVTKVAGFRGAEDIVLRTKILRWTLDVKIKNPEDRDLLSFLGVNHVCEGEFGKLIGNKSHRPYWGIRFDLGEGRYMNYAFTIGNMDIMKRMKIFRDRV